MQFHLHKRFQQDPAAAVIENILRKCVHCGMCNATCPTYQLRGDELDGPRGRIDQIKQFFEGAEANTEIQLHLDRCLTCRSCETTCPSGVQYSRLLAIGRERLETVLPRPARQHYQRWGITRLLNSGKLFKTLLNGAQMIAPMLPKQLQAKIPARQLPITRPSRQHAHRVLMLSGCVQPALAPNTNAMAIRLLDRIGISTIEIGASHCCGAIGLHTSQFEQGRAQARKLIDLWWPYVESGIEAIVMTATGCGVTIKDYVGLFQDEPAYAERASKISALVCDLSVLIDDEIDKMPQITTTKRVAVHTPCSQQHGLGLNGKVEHILKQVGYSICHVDKAHWCCGSAGTYSMLQPELSKQLREQQQTALMIDSPDVIATSNIGCQLQLANGSEVPVVHWVELVEFCFS